MAVNRALLDAVSRSARQHALALTLENAAAILADSSREFDVTVWTVFTGGKKSTRSGEEKVAPWREFGEWLADYAKLVVEKGCGAWYMGARSENGRCRDQDIDAVTQLTFDTEHTGDWVRVRHVLEAAGLGHVVQRSSSHTPDDPRWHLSLPMTDALACRKWWWRLAYRHLIVWFATVGGLAFDLASDPPVYGFDPAIDRLGQPVFPAARRTQDQLPPETACSEGRALNLIEFLERTGFDPWRDAKHVRSRSRAGSAPKSPRLAGTSEATKPFELLLAFRAAGMLGPQVGAGKWAVRCPWEDAHTTGSRFDSSTVVFRPRAGKRIGGFHCSHAHCADRGVVEVLAALPAAAVLTAKSELARANGPDEHDLLRPPLTDSGNAERVIELFGRQVRYVGTWRRWIVSNGSRWQLDETNLVQDLGKRMVRTLYGVASRVEDPDRRRALAQFAIACEARPRREAMICLAASERTVAITHRVLDVNHWMLNVQNGTLDLRTGQLLPHNPDDLITKIVDVPYIADAEAPLWHAFLRRITAGDEGLQSFLQRAAGYSLTGNVGEQCLLFIYGLGANGKTIFMLILKAIAGEYAITGAPNLLLLKRNDEHPTGLADLFGARIVLCPEMEAGRSFSEVLIKQLTGGDPIKARRMHEDFWEFSPTHKLWLSGNHRPIVRGTDHGIWRRIRLIPFTVTIPKDEQDRELLNKLRRELPGILRWAVDGCLAWQRDGLAEPAVVRDATDVYRAEQDLLAQFIADACVVGPTNRVSQQALRAAYDDWCRANGATAVESRDFASGLQERGVVAKDSIRIPGVKNPTRGWVGLALRSEERTFNREAPHSHPS